MRGWGYGSQLTLNDLLFNKVWTLMLIRVGLIILVDLWGSRVRRSLVS